MTTTLTTKDTPVTAERGNAAARARRLRGLGMALLGWTVALLIFFPIFWMIVTGFKTEAEAIAEPSLIFTPTLESYAEVQERADYVKFAWNSVVVAFGSTLLALLIAIPSAYSMAFLPTRRTKAPCCGCCRPRCCRRSAFWYRSICCFAIWAAGHPDRSDHRLHADESADRGVDALHLLQGSAAGHSRGGTHGWREHPAGNRLSAAAPDTPRNRFHRPAIGDPELERVLLEPQPDDLPGSAADCLHRLLLESRGLFWAKLSAASTMAIAPILVFGWLTQKQMVRGLTFGAVK